MERRFNRRSFSPVRVGDEVTVTIESVGAKGDGVAKVKGFVIFIPGAKQGETVKVRIARVLRSVGFADIIGKEEKKGTPRATEDAESQEDEGTELKDESEEEIGDEEEAEDGTGEESNEDTEEF